MTRGQEPAYPACCRPLPALLRLASRTLPACPRRPQPRADGCCQVMVTQLKNKCSPGSRGLGPSAWLQPWVGGGEAALGRGCWYLWGEVVSPPHSEGGCSLLAALGPLLAYGHPKTACGLGLC